MPVYVPPNEEYIILCLICYRTGIISCGLEGKVQRINVTFFKVLYSMCVQVITFPIYTPSWRVSNQNNKKSVHRYQKKMYVLLTLHISYVTYVLPGDYSYSITVKYDPDIVTTTTYGIHLSGTYKPSNIITMHNTSP